MKTQHSLKKSPAKKASAEKVVQDIRRQTRRHFSAEDKIRIVLNGPRGEDMMLQL
jgi:transposase